ncbi:mucoidy inhibitor MuiA family protein [Celeribacter sp. ULVN23_4]
MLPKFHFKSVLAFSCLAGSALIAAPGFAERFEARSLVSAATLYPQGAMITRTATVSLPEGQHEIVFADIPVGYNPLDIQQSLQIEVEGAELGPVAYGVAPISEALLFRSEAEKAAKARVDALETDIGERRNEIMKISLEEDAAQDALAYLERLTVGEDAEQTAATVRMIREESLAARLASLEAARRVEAAEKALEDLEAALTEAKIALDLLVPTDEDRISITLPVSVAEAGEVQVRFTYMSEDASWQPRYIARLDTEAGTMELVRSVFAEQSTREPWFDVALRFATDNPNRKPAPNEVYEYVRRVSEPRPVEPLMRATASDAMELGGYAEPVMEAAPMAKMQVNLSGLSQTYDAPAPATLYSGTEGREFMLASVPLSPEIVVRAVPLYETTGYLMATFTNDTGEMLVPGQVSLIRDGVSLGTVPLATVVNGAETELAFGAVDGIAVERVLVTRNESDRGVISKSNEAASEWRISVENHTARQWPVEVVDRVSVSEQEELRVEWSAQPEPDVEGLDDKRGVLAWHFDLDAGAKQEITLSESLRWPEGKELR